MSDNFGEELVRVFTYPFDDQFLPEQDTSSSPAAAGTTTPTITGENSVEAQSAQRRLARLSRYFTTPTGVLDSSTGSQGVF